MELVRRGSVHSGDPVICVFASLVQRAGSGSQGLSARARVMAWRAVSPWFAADDLRRRPQPPPSGQHDPGRRW